VNELILLRSDEKVNEFLERPPMNTSLEAKSFIERIHKSISDHKSMYWVISLKDNRTLIGTICFWNLVPEQQLGEIGFELMPAYQGKGLMQEAITHVITFGFREMKLKTITAISSIGNNKSIKLLEKNKFILDTTNKFLKEEERGTLLAYYLSGDE
jgi:ribosomal-protein-alanine N-acetyltransferase